MKFLILSLALVAAAMADVSELGGYDYHAPAASHDHGDFGGGDQGYSSSAPANTYIPPAAPSNSYIPPAASAPANSYIPPAASAPANSYIPPAAPSNSYIPPAASAPSASFGDDGYRYKTQRRRVYRHRF